MVADIQQAYEQGRSVEEIAEQRGWKVEHVQFLMLLDTLSQPRS